jgi:hypothetical protein
MANFMDAFAPPAVDTSSVDNTDSEEALTDDATDDVADDSSEDTDTDEDSGEESDEADTSEEDEDGEADADEQQEQKTGDGRTLPSKLKELCKAHPDAAKLIKDLYFTNQALTQYGKPGEIRKMKEAIESFGSVDNVVKMKQTLDIIGGEEGLQQLQSSLEQWNNVDKQFMDGSPEFIDNLIEASPEAFEKIMPTALVRLGSTAPETYNNMMAQVMWNTFANDGTIINLSMLKQALAAGNTELANSSFQKIEASLGNIQQLAQQAPKAKQVDPKAQAFEQERKTFQQQQQQAFTNEVQQTNSAWIRSSVTKELTTFLKGKKPSDAQLNRMESAIREEIGTVLEKNTSLVKQVEALRNRRDKDGLVRLYKQHIGKLLPETTRKIAREFGLNPGIAKKGVTTAKPGQKVQGKAESGWQPVSKLPDHTEVDKNLTTDDMIFEGKVITKDGRRLKLV